MLHSSKDASSFLLSRLAAKQRFRHLAMAHGHSDPGCILYRLGRAPFLLRRILSFEASRRDLQQTVQKQKEVARDAEDDSLVRGAS